MGLLGGGGTSDLKRVSRAGFRDSALQKFLPNALQSGFGDDIGRLLSTGIQGIGDLIRNPGGLAPNVLDAIRPRLAAESENIAQNFRGIGSQQAGTLARTNAPVSIRSALESALNTSQERAQRGARREALSDSDQLRRQDSSQIFNILDAILQFMSSGRGQAIQGLGAVAQADAQKQAALVGAAGAAAGGFASRPPARSEEHTSELQSR